jgi:hypothetical protein
MAIYTYITETTMKGTADDPAKKFIVDNFKGDVKRSIFYGDGKAVVSVVVGDDVKATDKEVLLTDRDLKESLSSKSSPTTASKLTSVGFSADGFILSRDSKPLSEAVKEVTK